MTLSHDSSGNAVDLSLLFLLFGKIEFFPMWLQELPSHFQQFYDLLGQQAEVIFLTDNPAWRDAVEFFLGDFPVSIHCFEGLDDNPARLLEKGLEYAHGEFLAFSFPGVSLVRQAQSFRTLLEEMLKDGERQFITGYPSDTERSHPAASFFFREAFQLGELKIIPLGFLQLFNMVPLSNSVVRKTLAATCGFSTEPERKALFWWDFCLRASVLTDILFFPVEGSPQVQYSLPEFPFRSGDVAVTSQTVRTMHHSVDRWNEAYYQGTLDGFALNAPQDSDTASAKPPLRVTVVGGIHEAVHNQLCFYNYFQKLAATNTIRWTTIYDEFCAESDLLDSDLVIFSRERSEHGVTLLEYCNRNKIPSLYMLDDNWFVVGTAFPELNVMFAPTGNIYKNFIGMVENSSAVICYNRYIEQALCHISDAVTRFEVNIDLDVFDHVREKTIPDTYPQNTVVIGYAGSPRTTNVAFEAMFNIADRYSNVKIFIMSQVIPEPLKKLPSDQILFHPYTHSYLTYIRTLLRVAPHIMVAPLGNNRFDASKCPNKYLEIGAVKAAGVYSDVEPYVHYIQHGQNGLLAANNVSAWEKALLALVEDKAGGKRAGIIDTAFRDVQDKFATASRAPAFSAFITGIASAGV